MPLRADKPLPKMSKEELVAFVADQAAHAEQIEGARQLDAEQLAQRAKRINALEAEVRVGEALANDLTAVAQDAIAHGDQAFHWEPNDYNGRIHSREISRHQEALQGSHERAEQRRRRNHERALLPAEVTMAEDAMDLTPRRSGS